MKAKGFYDERGLEIGDDKMPIFGTENSRDLLESDENSFTRK